MDYRDIIFKPGAVARVILNRPKYHNAQPMRMVEEMDDAFRRALGDSETRVIVLSGAGPSFSAGHDLGTPEALADREARGYQQDIPSEYDRTREYWYEASMRWRNIPLPTIAMVHGYCIYGGWIFAASMDLVFASDDALFLPSHTQYFTAPWDIGPRRAKEILYEGRFITAQEAHDFGFVSRVFAAHELEKNTIDYANRVAQQTRCQTANAVLMGWRMQRTSCARATRAASGARMVHSEWPPGRVASSRGRRHRSCPFLRHGAFGPGGRSSPSPPHFFGGTGRIGSRARAQERWDRHQENGGSRDRSQACGAFRRTH